MDRVSQPGCGILPVNDLWMERSMADKKSPEALNDADLEDATGGLSLSPTSTDAGSTQLNTNQSGRTFQDLKGANELNTNQSGRMLKINTNQTGRT